MCFKFFPQVQFAFRLLQASKKFSGFIILDISYNDLFPFSIINNHKVKNLHLRMLVKQSLLSPQAESHLDLYFKSQYIKLASKENNLQIN